MNNNIGLCLAVLIACGITGVGFGYLTGATLGFFTSLNSAAENTSPVAEGVLFDAQIKKLSDEGWVVTASVDELTGGFAVVKVKSPPVLPVKPIPSYEQSVAFINYTFDCLSGMGQININFSDTQPLSENSSSVDDDDDQRIRVKWDDEIEKVKVLIYKDSITFRFNDVVKNMSSHNSMVFEVKSWDDYLYWMVSLKGAKEAINGALERCRGTYAKN